MDTWITLILKDTRIWRNCPTVVVICHEIIHDAWSLGRMYGGVKSR